MEKRTSTGADCAIAEALAVLGDAWTLRIVHEAFFGATRFTDLQQALGISRNVLSGRLTHLVEHGILDRVDAGRTGQRFEYRLTDKGEALLPTLTALRDWADEWIIGAGNEPLIITDRKTRRRIPKLRVRDGSGRILTRADLQARPGPGAE